MFSCEFCEISKSTFSQNTTGGYFCKVPDALKISIIDVWLGSTKSRSYLELM